MIGFRAGGKRHNIISMIDHPRVEPEPNSGCWLWVGARGPNGHGIIRQGQIADLAHRISWRAEHGPIPCDKWVLHKCNNASCCNPDHLYLGTHADNMRDMKMSNRRKGKCASKLTAEKVIRIRSDVRPQSIIAADYGIGQDHVSRIKARKTWSHI
jgi:hypothetical protein